MKLVDRCVFVGGFGSSEETVVPVAHALEQRGDYKSIEAIGFSEARKNPEIFGRMTADAAAILTHSAGVLLALDSAPNGQKIHAIAPPIRRSAIELATTRTVRKAITMHRNIDTTLRRIAVQDYERASARELLHHPFANFSQLGRIAGFDIRDQSGFNRPFYVGLMDQDEFFGMSEEDYQTLIGYGNNVQYFPLAGEHDELLLDPQMTLDEYYARLSEVY
ncbi:MAG TPA: hypothetical protein PLU21_03095 [Candidatus Saccharibacteria bacterium]|nr:hypothetical protein [Candidatus Saccharibacteria bacterium]